MLYAITDYSLPDPKTVTNQLDVIRLIATGTEYHPTAILKYYIDDVYDYFHQQIVGDTSDGMEYADSIITPRDYDSWRDGSTVYQFYAYTFYNWKTDDLRYVIYIYVDSDDRSNPYISGVVEQLHKMRLTEENIQEILHIDESIVRKHYLPRVPNLAERLRNGDYELGLPVPIISEYDALELDILKYTVKQLQPNDNYTLDDILVRSIVRDGDTFIQLLRNDYLQGRPLQQFDYVWYSNDTTVLGPEDAEYVEEISQVNNTVRYNYAVYTVTRVGNNLTLTSPNKPTLYRSPFDDTIRQLLLRHDYVATWNDADQLPEEIGVKYNQLLDQLEVLVPRFGYLDYNVANYYLTDNNRLDRSEVLLLVEQGK